MDIQEARKLVASENGKQGRKNLREKLGEEGFRKYMGRLGKKNKGKKRKKSYPQVDLQSNS